MRADMNPRYNSTDVGLSILFQSLFTTTTNSSSSDYEERGFLATNLTHSSNYSLDGASVVLRDVPHDVTPFWQRSMTLWLTVTLSLLLLTALAGAINIYIWYLQNKKHQKDSFVSFLTRSRSSSVKGSSQKKSDTPKASGKFRVMKI